jgi:DNA-directed RNA polymerase specialized sigma24 family protein
VTENKKYAYTPNLWVDQFSDEFFRFAIYRVKKRKIAEDLVQKTFL